MNQLKIKSISFQVTPISQPRRKQSITNRVPSARPTPRSHGSWPVGWPDLSALSSHAHHGCFCHSDRVGSEARKLLRGRVTERRNPLYVCTATSPAAKPSPDNPAGESAVRMNTHKYLTRTQTHIGLLLHGCSGPVWERFEFNGKHAPTCGLSYLQPAWWNTSMLQCTCACSHQARIVRTCTTCVFVSMHRCFEHCHIWGMPRVDSICCQSVYVSANSTIYKLMQKSASVAPAYITPGPKELHMMLCSKAMMSNPKRRQDKNRRHLCESLKSRSSSGPER